MDPVKTVPRSNNLRSSGAKCLAETHWGLIPCALLAVLLTFAPATGNDWTRFRGENGAGISTLKGVPAQWTEADYEWKVDLPGVGHSSPVLWGDRLFVASGQDDGTRLLLCLNALTGESVWSQSVHLEPEPHVSDRNSYGSSTPLVDDERVYVAFADTKHYLFLAFDHDGRQLWSTDLGPFESMHGQGHAPILYGEAVILANDQKGPSFVVALDRKTGQELWRSPRAVREAAYATPMLLTVDGQQPQLICISGATGVSGLSLETGETLWSSGELPMRVVASPVSGEGVVIASCGKGGRGHHMVAVEPSLDPSIKQASIRWTRTQSLPYVPTPVVSDGLLYLWADEGIVLSVNMQTGETIDRLRVGGNYYSSPVIIDHKLYCPSDDGEIAVVATQPKLELLGKSPLGDKIHSTPAVANDRVYFRGFRTLACLKAR